MSKHISTFDEYYINLPCPQQQVSLVGHLLQASCCLKLELQGSDHLLMKWPMIVNRSMSNFLENFLERFLVSSILKINSDAKHQLMNIAWTTNIFIHHRKIFNSKSLQIILPKQKKKEGPMPTSFILMVFFTLFFFYHVTVCQKQQSLL